MSSVRLFILGSLEERGEMHGHAIRMLAEEEHIDSWTDFGPGSIYGAIKRLAADGLIEERRTEREGSYPERQVYGITPSGTKALAELRREGLQQIFYRHDPVDLALARLDPEGLDAVGGVLAARLAELRERQAEGLAHLDRISHYLTPIERQIMRHQYHRLSGEIAWHEEFIANLPALVAEEKSRKGHPAP